MTRHKCQHFSPPWRGHRRCRYCNRGQYLLPDKTWAFSMTLEQFANKWLPAISGTTAVDLMRVDVAFPFEWNCYESWNIVFRVRFDFSEIRRRLNPDIDLSTGVDGLDGWQSSYHEDFCRIDYEAQQEFERLTGRPYMIGDNAYAEMRRIIQS